MNSESRNSESVRVSSQGPTKNAVDASDWFVDTIKIPAPAQALLEQYSGLETGEVIPHVTDLRARAFKIKPYPCIGQVSFLDFYLTNHPAYAEVLQRIKTGHSFLDAGCCLGQSLRRLLFDGAPSSNALYGLDIEPAFFDLGHDLFRDRDRMHATFITADLTDPFVTAIEPFTSKIDIISAIGFFHLFNLEDQKTVAQHLASLTTPIAGSMIIGLHIGTIKAVERHAGFQDSDVFFHDLESFEQLWQDVGTATGTKWKVDARVEELPDISKSRAWCKPDTTRFIFTVRRE